MFTTVPPAVAPSEGVLAFNSVRKEQVSVEGKNENEKRNRKLTWTQTGSIHSGCCTRRDQRNASRSGKAPVAAESNKTVSSKENDKERRRRRRRRRRKEKKKKGEEGEEDVKLTSRSRLEKGKKRRK